MKLYTTNRINAVGLTGPEETHKHFPEAELIKVDNTNIQESEQILYKKAKQIFTKSENPIFIGGDHSITYPLFKAFKQLHKNPFLIIFDAHADCDIPTQEPSHEEWLRKTIEDGFPGNKTILIGTRKTWEIENKFLKQNKVKIYPNIPNKKEIQDLTKNHDLYISIDIDAFDSSIAPAANYPEPAGLNKTEFLNFLQTLNPKAIDITEACPSKDQNNKTLNLIKKIIQNLIP